MLSELDFAELFASRLVWRLLRVFLRPPFVAHRQSALSGELAVPDASVQRGLRALVVADIVRRRQSQYVANTTHPAFRYLWMLREVERADALPADVRNALAVLQGDAYAQADSVVVFGSWPRGIAVRGESDVDVAVFTDAPREADGGPVFHGSLRLELQYFPLAQLAQPANTAALDALLSGISVQGRERVADAAIGLRRFPKPFLIKRLEQASSFLRREEDVADEAVKEHFAGLADRAIGQVRAILLEGRTKSWRETAREPDPRHAIDELAALLAKEGDEVWLT